MGTLTQNNSQINEIKGQAFDEVHSLSCHGLRHSFRAGTFIIVRIIWVLCFSSASIFSLVRIANILSIYSSYPIEKEVRVVFTAVEFPAVTFCNLNTMRQSQLSLGGPELANAISAIEAAQQLAITGSASSTSKKKRSVRQFEKTDHSSRGVKRKTSVLNNPEHEWILPILQKIDNNVKKNNKNFPQEPSEYSIWNRQTVLDNEDQDWLESVMKQINRHGITDNKYHNHLSGSRVVHADREMPHKMDKQATQQGKDNHDSRGHGRQQTYEKVDQDPFIQRIKRSGPSDIWDYDYAQYDYINACDNTATSPTSGIFYCLVKQAMTWTVAKYICENIVVSEGPMSLAIIPSSTTNEFTDEVEWMQGSSLMSGVDDKEDVWIGMYRNLATDDHFWINGVQITVDIFQGKGKGGGKGGVGDHDAEQFGYLIDMGKKEETGIEKDRNWHYFLCSTFSGSIYDIYHIRSWDIPKAPTTTTDPQLTTKISTAIETTTIEDTTTELVTTEMSTPVETTALETTTIEDTTTELVTTEMSTPVETTILSNEKTTEPSSSKFTTEVTTDLPTSKSTTQLLETTTTAEETTTGPVTTKFLTPFETTTLSIDGTSEQSTSKFTTEVNTDLPTSEATTQLLETTTTAEETTTEAVTTEFSTPIETTILSIDVTTEQSTSILSTTEAIKYTTKEATTELSTSEVTPELTTKDATTEVRTGEISSDPMVSTESRVVSSDVTIKHLSTEFATSQQAPFLEITSLPSVPPMNSSTLQFSILYSRGTSISTTVQELETPTHSGIITTLSTVATEIITQIPFVTFPKETFTQAPLEEGQVPDDPSDAPFIPDVDFSKKPWFQVAEGPTPSVEIEALSNVTQALSNIPTDTREIMGHQLDDMLKDCTWSGKPCQAKQFTSYVDDKYGNCFTFNAGPNTTREISSKPGQLYGLSMMLYIEQKDYVASLSPESGVRLVIHHNDDKPFPQDQGIDVSAGYNAQVKLRMVKYELHEPYRNCTLEMAAPSEKECRRECTQSKKVSQCGCADATLPIPQGARVCGSTDLGCTELIDQQISSGDIVCPCQRLCRDRNYVPSVTISRWPGEAYEKVISESLSMKSPNIADILKEPGAFRNNLLKVDIFYDEIKYLEEIEKPAYVVSQLLSDIGGVAGMCIGMSLLATAEIFQLLVRAIHLLVIVIMNRTQHHKDNNFHSVETSNQPMWAIQIASLEVAPNVEMVDLQIEELHTPGFATDQQFFGGLNVQNSPPMEISRENAMTYIDELGTFEIDKRYI